MTIYQGTKVPPHRYLQYTNIDLYTIHIASKRKGLQFWMEEGWIRATQKGLHSPWLTSSLHWRVPWGLFNSNHESQGIWCWTLDLNNLFVYCIGKLIVWILKLYVHLLLQYKTILLKFKFIIKKIYKKFVNRLIIKKIRECMSNEIWWYRSVNLN